MGPFALTSYEMARAMAPAMTTEVAARRMPPWGAQDTNECAPPLPWRHDERLTDQEIIALQRWEAAGAPEGNPSDAPPEVAPFQSTNLVTPTLELEPKAAYLPRTSSGDEFRCFVIDAPEIEPGGYLSAIHVVPGNRKIVHHVSVFADVNGVASSRAGADGSFDCSLEAGAVSQPIAEVQPQLAWLLAWAPGARPLELPQDLGIHVHPKSKIIMEIHYSMSGTTPEPDRTRLQMLMAPSKPEYAVSSWAIGNFGGALSNGDGLLPGDADENGVEFRIPANARNHVEQMLQSSPLEGPLPIFGIRAHAHFAAVDLKIDVIRNGAEQCLLQDAWDVHWQRVYTYDAAVQELPTVRAGDKIRVRCTYDNSMMNRRLAPELKNRGLQPMDLTLGHWSTSEMCMAELLFLQKTP